MLESASGQRMKRPLDISDFNDKGELKTPLKLVLALLFMSRHLIFLMLAGLTQFVGARRGFHTDTYWLPEAWLLFADIPVFLFLVLVARKEKLTKQGWLRSILYRGVPLMVALGVLQLLLIVGLEYRLLLKPEPLRLVELVLLVVCVYYLAVNPKLKLFFQEYGQPPSRS